MARRALPLRPLGAGSTRHDDLDFPKQPVDGEYVCHKHRRVCHPVEEAGKFLRRYARDAVQRIQEFGDLRTDWPVTVIHGDARAVDPPDRVDLVITSPPYPGLIDYHGQHAYAYELLGLARNDAAEIGRGPRGYCDSVAEVLRRAASALTNRGRIVDRRKRLSRGCTTACSSRPGSGSRPGSAAT